MSLADKLGIKMSSRKITLPSNGIYGGPSEVMVRPLLARDEKFIAGIEEATAESSLIELAKSVTLDELETENLIDSDILFILLVSKCLTYSDAVETQYNCVRCDKESEYNLQLFEYPVKLLKETSFTVELPKSNLTIKYKIMTLGEKKKIESTYRQQFILTGADPDEELINQHMVASSLISVSKDDEDIALSLTEKNELISELLTKADTDIWSADLEDNDVSPKYTYQAECSHCGTINTKEVVLTPSFFFTEALKMQSV
jgi:hypothetical protein